jgi:hypothetical protein
MKFKDIQFVDTKNPNGVQALIECGIYEISVIKNDISYGGKAGLYEIGIFHNDKLISLPGITEDGDTVKGFLNESGVEAILMKLFLITRKGPVQQQVENWMTT